MKEVVVFSILVFFILVGGAHAVLLDFTQPGFEPPNNAQSFTYDPEGLMISADPKDGGALLYWDKEDGYGVKNVGYEEDEIEGKETLKLQFKKKRLLHKILITDLFIESRTFVKEYAEIGKYSLDEGNTWEKFVADGALPNGEFHIDFATPEIINSIWFRAPGKISQPQNGISIASFLQSCCDRLPPQDHEFSVGGVDVSAVPEPSTMLLVGAGLLGLAGFRRKLRKK